MSWCTEFHEHNEWCTSLQWNTCIKRVSLYGIEWNRDIIRNVNLSIYYEQTFKKKFFFLWLDSPCQAFHSKNLCFSIGNRTCFSFSGHQQKLLWGLGVGVSPKEQVWTGLQWSSPDVTSRGQGSPRSDFWEWWGWARTVSSNASWIMAPTPTSWTEWWTGKTENITFPQLCWQAVTAVINTEQGLRTQTLCAFKLQWCYINRIINRQHKYFFIKNILVRMKMKF